MSKSEIKYRMQGFLSGAATIGFLAGFFALMFIRIPSSNKDFFNMAPVPGDFVSTIEPIIEERQAGFAGIKALAAILIVMAIALALPVMAGAASVRLAWDANDPVPEGYRIFVRPAGGAYDYAVPAWQGPETTGAVDGLDRGSQYAFVVRAYQGGLESADSAEVVYTVPAENQVIVYPKQPSRIIIEFVGD